MARPPFEEQVLTAKRPWEEGMPGGKIVPVPQSFSNSLTDEPGGPSSSPSRWEALSRVLTGIGLVGGMLGIGAFVGIVVLLMSRVEVTTRLPPTGLPVESASHSSGATSPAPVVLTARPPGSPSPSGGPKTSATAALPASAGEDTWDRTQLLLQMEIVELDRDSAEAIFRQSPADPLSQAARTILEALLQSQGFLEAAEKDASSAREGSASSPSRKSADGSGASSVRDSGNSEGSFAKAVQEKASPGGSSEGSSSPEGPSREPSSRKLPPSSSSSGGSPPEKPPSVQDPHSSLLRGGKNTKPFLDRWVEPRNFLPSKPSDALEASEPATGLESSQSREPPSSKEGGSNPEEPPPSSDRGTRTSSAQQVQPIAPLGISREILDAGLGELQRRGVLRRVGAAQFAVLHRWPTQIELVPSFFPFGLGENGAKGSLSHSPTSAVSRAQTPLEGSSAPARSEGFFSSGRVHCFPEAAGEDRFRVELLAEFFRGETSGSLEPSKTPAGKATDGEHSSQGPVWYGFPKITCPAGKWLVMAGRRESPDEKNKPDWICAIVRGEVQKARPELARLPLSESERRERGAAQCRHLEAWLRARFPQTRVQLTLAAGKIFVYGRTSDWRQMEEILEVVRRRAVEQWKVHETQTARNLTVGASEAGESPVVNMLQVAQVQVRVQLWEFGPEAAGWIESGKLERTSSSGASAGPGGLSQETRNWLHTLAEAIHRHRATVVIAPSAKQWEELVGRKFARVLCDPYVVTASGQRETVRLDSGGDSVRGGSDASAASDNIRLSETRRTSTPEESAGRETSEAVKTKAKTELVVDILPELAEGGRLRLEVAPALEDITQTAEYTGPSGVVAQARLLHIKAVLQQGEVLLIPVGWEAGSSPNHASAQKPPLRFLLVSADSGAKGRDAPTADPNESFAASSSRTYQPTSVRKAEKASYEEAWPAPIPGKDTSPPLSREASSRDNRAPSDDPLELSLAQLAESGRLVLEVGRRLVLTSERDILRAHVMHPDVCEVYAASPRQLVWVGKAEGNTEGVLWLQDGNQKTLHFPIRVVSPAQNGAWQEERIKALEEVLGKLFPRSQVRLRWEGDRWVVEGQSPHPAEVSQILAVIRAEAVPPVPSCRVSVVSRVRVMTPGPIQYLVRARFAAVDASRLRGAADQVKRESPGMVPLAGSLLELAEQGGYLFLEARDVMDLGEQLRQAEQRDLVRLIAQPTFGILPGQPAEYLLPFPSRNAGEAVPSNRPVGNPSARYLFWRLTPRWVEEGRWQLETTVQSGGSDSPAGKDQRGRLMIEMEPGQIFAAAIPEQFWPGPGRLVILTSVEMRTLPVEASEARGPSGTTSTEPGSHTSLSKAPRSTSSGEPSEGPPLPVKTLPRPSSSFASGQNLEPAASGVSLPSTSRVSSSPSSAPSAIPSGSSPQQPSPQTTASNRASWQAASKLSPEPPRSPGQQSVSPSGSLDQGSSEGPAKSHHAGLLGNLTRFFRPRNEQKTSSPPGFILLDAPDPPESKALEITVPESPPEKAARSAVVPRVLRPSTTR